ncbi:MAG: DUF2752 domain-containing protein [Pyrinomonadaceae bacterium]
MARRLIGPVLASLSSIADNPRALAIVTWLTSLLVLTYVFMFDPGRTGFFPPCPFRALTGLTCPGCGSTRCLHQLVHGNIASAFKLNPLLIISLPFLIWALMRYTRNAFRNSPRRLPLRAVQIWPVVAIVAAFWFFRNTSYYPFQI